MPDTTISIKDQAAYLRANDFWIGRTYSESFVKNLYDLASRNVITSKQWNDYGDVSKSWDKQSRAILLISAIPDPKQARTPEEKAAVLKINGYWIDGKAVGKDVIDNLYTLHANGKISADEWNKLGVATLPWDKQNASITSRLDRPAETPEGPKPAVAEEDAPAAPPATEPESAPATPEPEPAPSAAEEDVPAAPPATEPEPAPIPAEPEADPAIEDGPAADAATDETIVPDADTGAARSYGSLLPQIKDPELPAAETEEAAPPAESTPAAPQPIVPPADITPETAPEKPATAGLTAEEKQARISELLELRENVKNASWYKEWKNPTLLPKSPRTNNEFKQLRKERINGIDEQIRALDPQAVPNDSVLWKPWTWNIFNN